MNIRAWARAHLDNLAGDLLLLALLLLAALVIGAYSLSGGAYL